MTTRLERIISPPESPLEVPTDSEWDAYEARLGTPLPGDYINHINQYGTGGFDSFIWIFNPKANNTYFNLLDQAERILLGVRGARDKFGREKIPFRLFPELGGLLPFGTTANGDILYWQTAGEPERWTVVVNASRSADFEELEMNMSTFLGAVLSGQLRCKAFPDDFPTEDPRFILPAYLRGAEPQ